MVKHNKMPLAVWILTLSAFAIGTAEFVIAGILTQVAEPLQITEGQVGHLITAYALAIVIGGPILTLWLARYDKKKVLIGLMVLFVVGNLITAFSSDYTILLASRVLAGLTLANVLGVPGGAYIGNAFGWDTTFVAVASLGVVTALSILVFIPPQNESQTPTDVRSQLRAFRDKNLLASLAITLLGWVGFMTFYGYIAPVAEQVAGFDRDALTWILVLVGFVASVPWAFLAAAFVFGVVSFANVPPMQMRVMKYGAAAPELSATANISAFNIANALGGLIGGAVVDSSVGAAAIPFAAIVIPIIGESSSSSAKSAKERRTAPPKPLNLEVVHPFRFPGA